MQDPRGQTRTREEDLVAKGWQRRSTHDDPRLSEMVALYEDIGLEVHIEPFDPQIVDGCRECMAASPDTHRTIYTRKRPEAD